MSTLQDRVNECLAGPPRKTQKALAAACGIKPPSVNDWTTGKTKSIQGEYLIPAATFLGVEPHWLATGKGKKYKNADDSGGGIHPLSDIKRTLMEHINRLDDGKLTLAIAPIIHDVIEVDPSKVDILQGLVHVVCQPRAQYHENDNHENDTKREANGE
jgi:hypothetical protein